VIELDLGNTKEKRLEGVYVSNSITNYTINAPSATVTHNQSVTQNNIINNEFNSIMQELDKSAYNDTDKQAIIEWLNEVKKDIESKNIPQGFQNWIN
jgi:hypothetical protein